MGALGAINSSVNVYIKAEVDFLLSAITAGIDNKDYVDTSTEGVGNITLSGEQTINGLLTSSSRVLVIEQTAGEDNGFYTSNAGAWTRSNDADSNDKITNGVSTAVDNSGSDVYRHKYLLITPDPITVGTTSLTFRTLPDHTDAQIKIAYENNANSNEYPDADVTKIGFISVTQAVDLDTIESDTATNNGKVSNANHTGDVTGSTALTIGANKVTNTKAAQMAAHTFKGNNTAGLANQKDLTIAEMQSELNIILKPSGIVNTTDATVTTVDTIDTLTDDSSHLIDVFVSTEQDTNAGGGVWAKTLFVTKRSGTVVIQQIGDVFFSNDATPPLLGNSLTFVINAGNIDIKVKGVAAKNYKWNSKYEIIQKTTN